MDSQLLALIEQSSESDLSSEGENSAVIPGFQEIQVAGSLLDQAKFKDWIFRAGSRFVGSQPNTVANFVIYQENNLYLLHTLFSRTL